MNSCLLKSFGLSFFIGKKLSVFSQRIRISHILSLLILLILLSGCGGMLAYREGVSLIGEGKNEQGLAKLEEAVRLEPNNTQYRITLANYRNSVVNRLIAVGETARHDGRLVDAEKIYRQVLAIEPANSMARQGLNAVVKERRHRQLVAEAEAIFKKGDAGHLAEALEILRPVLSENPEQKDALNLKARIDDALSKDSQAEAKLAAAFRKPISLEFRDAPLKSVLEVISKVSGLNFFYDKDIKPDIKAALFAKNTTVEDALRLVLVTNQLEHKILSENSILIYPNTPQKLKDYQTLAVRTFYLTNADVKGVSNTIKSIVKTKDIVIDERLGIIIMRDTPQAIRMAERIVAMQDLSEPEVMLEVEIMEIKRARLMELGIQWPSQLTLSPLETAGNPFTLNDLRNLSGDTIQASIGSLIINARKENQDANILANPRIRVRNKEKAKIQIGDRVPVITTTSTSTGFVSESVNYIDVGLKLEVEPNIYLDEEVAIKINLEVSNLVREVFSKTGTLSYQIGTRGANTVLRLKDGETQILAGLISDEDRMTANRVPIIGELPIMSRLFGSQKDDTQRSEILLSITPRVVRSIRRADLIAAEFESGTENNIGAKSLRLSTVQKDAKDSGDKKGPAVGKTAEKPAVGNDVRPGPAPSGITPPSAVSVPGAFSLSWQAPPKIKAGEQFSAVLRVTSQNSLLGLPLLIGFDTQLLQVASVQEGEFLKQNGGSTNFSHRVDPAQGKIFIASVRQNASGSDKGVNGSGTLLTVNFKALKPKSGAASTKVQLLSASPEPAPATPVAVPVEQIVQIAP